MNGRRLFAAALLVIAPAVQAAPLDPLALIAREAPRRPLFLPWHEEREPSVWWGYRHIRHLARCLDRVTWGLDDRLVINIPPRHGKSETTTVRYVAMRITADPTLRVVVASNNAVLARKFSRAIRNRVKRHVAISQERAAQDEWYTIHGGGVRAVGRGGAIHGFGAGLIVIDDPIATREEADSPIERDKAWDWYRDDILSRTEPGAAIILPATRFHPDDIPGRIAASETASRYRWCVLPALALANDPLGRAEGEALNPERYTRDDLLFKRIEEGEYAFESKYQQHPVAREGRLFDIKGFTRLDAMPEPAVFSTLVRYWDTAGSEKKRRSHDPDATAGVLVGRRRDTNMFVVLHVALCRKKPDERDAFIAAVARADHRRYGGRTQQWVEQEAGVAGEDRTRALLLAMAGVPVRSEPATQSKILRAEPAASQVKAGNVALAPDDAVAPWVAEFLAELSVFPGGGAGVHDDQVDGFSGAMNKLIHAPAAVLSRFSPL